MSNEPGYLQVVLMGLITVFVVLICLIIIIKIMGAIVTKATAKNAATPVAAVPVPAVVSAAPAANNRKLVAAVSAVLAEEMGAEVSHIRIHSIKKL